MKADGNAGEPVPMRAYQLTDNLALLSFMRYILLN